MRLKIPHVHHLCFDFFIYIDCHIGKRIILPDKFTAHIINDYKTNMTDYRKFLTPSKWKCGDFITKTFFGVLFWVLLPEVSESSQNDQTY